MRADVIASHGRTGQVTALALGSFGRLLKAMREFPPIVVGGIREVWNLLSKINTVVNIESRIAND